MNWMTRERLRNLQREAECIDELTLLVIEDMKINADDFSKYKLEKIADILLVNFKSNLEVLIDEAKNKTDDEMYELKQKILNDRRG